MSKLIIACLLTLLVWGQIYLFGQSFPLEWVIGPVVLCTTTYIWGRLDRWADNELAKHQEES